MTQPNDSNQDSTILGQSLADDDKSGGQQDNTDTQGYLDKFVGEGKKYQSVEDLAKAYANADSFIETMKIENKASQMELEELRKKAEKAQDIDAVVEMLRGNQKPKTESDGQEDPKPSQKDYSEEELAKLVTSVMEKKENEKKTQAEQERIKQNQAKAWEILAKPAEEGGFGSQEAAKKAVREAIEANPSRKDIINQLGSYDPDALAPFLKTLTPAKEGDKMYTPSDDSKMSVAQPSSFDGELTWTKAKQIKKDNPKLYKSVKFQQQMHQAAARLGDKFFNN